MNTKKIISVAGMAVALGLVAIAPAFAETSAKPTSKDGQGMVQGQARSGTRPSGMMVQGVFGTVTAVSGNTITITSKQGMMGERGGSKATPTASPSVAATSVTYTIDATNAVIKKDNATTTISSIAVGDTIMAQGTITGTNVVATSIRDGAIGDGKGQNIKDSNGSNKGHSEASTTMQVIGNGQPVVAGTVSAVSGSTLTVTTSGGVVYTVDATNAKVLQNQETSTLSSVVVGNKVLVQGTTNGTSVVASTIVNQTSTASTNGSGENSDGSKSQSRGFFGGIASFFTHLFGF